MAELFRFRCSECSKLLGVATSKIGSKIRCPQCKTALIVPSPDDDGETVEEAGGLGFDSLGIDLGPAEGRGEPSPPDGVDPPVDLFGEVGSPVAFLEGHSQAEPPNRAGPSVQEHRPPDRADRPRPKSGNFEPGEGAPASTAAVATIDRRRDVVLPRSAVIAWSIFSLGALAGTFLAGFLIGRFF